MNIKQAAVPLILLFGYATILVLMIFRRQERKRTERTLILYMFVSTLWDVAVALAAGLIDNEQVIWFSERIALAGLLVLAIILYNLIYALLRRETNPRLILVWWALGVVYLLLFVLVITYLLPFQIIQITIGETPLSADAIIQVFSILGWGVFTLIPILAVWHDYQQATSPMHRNRYRYLFLTLVLQVLGDAFFASQRTPLDALGISMRFSGALVLILVTYSHYLPDIRIILRYALGYVVYVLVAVSIGFGLMWGISVLFQGEWLYGALIGASVAAAFLSFATPPLRRGIQKLVDRGLFHVDTADYDSVLRTYGERVIETLRLEPLADLVMDTIMYATGTVYGGLYIVREGKEEIGGLLLDPIMLRGALAKESFELHPDSPLARQLYNSDEPVSQYDVDLRAQYAQVPLKEREWLHKTGFELLLPVHTSDKLIGVVALGPKESGELYTQKELNWLKALADQTAVALQNARLFDQVEAMSINVMRLNADLERTNKELARTNKELAETNANLEQAYTRLQELDKLKSDFIGVITHELRTPFVSAGFSIQLLSRYVEKRMFDELSAQITQLDKELAAGRQMIDRVISFASLLSKQGELKRERTDMTRLIREAIAPLETMARSRHIDLKVDLDTNLPRISVDQSRLGEAIYHMVHNAIKFNHEGGTVNVTCRREDGHIHLEVQDTGCGIPADRLATIWDAFTQVADSVNRGVEGLGLGLPLIKFVVEAHGGTVWVTSEPGQGSTFGFKLPIQAI